MSYLEMARRIIAETGPVATESAAGGQTSRSEPPHGLGRCIRCAAELSVGVLIAYCAGCRRGDGHPSAVESRPSRYPLRIVIESDAPVPDNAVADLAVLRRVVADYAAIWHEDARFEEALELGERIDELLDRLAGTNCRVRIEALS